MTEEEKTQAAMYLKLQDDVTAMVRDIVIEVFKSYNGEIRSVVETMTLGSSLFEQRVKQVVQNQWNKY